MKGENIFKRKDGRWEARYIKGRDVTGKIVYGFCYGKTYREAKEKADGYKIVLSQQPAAGKIILPQARSQRLSHYCDEWLRACRYRLKESTCNRYETAVNNHIRPRLGNLFPQEIGDETASAFASLLLSEGLAPKTVKDILAVLRLIMKHASKQLPGLIGDIGYAVPKSPKKESRVLSYDEQEKLITYLAKDSDACKFGILLAMFTGLRIGELCALKWDNISLKERTLRVTATMQRIKNDGEGSRTKVVIGTPKSDLSTRVIPLSDAALRLCRSMDVKNRNAYILTGSEIFMEPRTLQYRLKRYAEDCGIEGVHFHTLRHTFATRCVEAGFELKSLSEILGHATTSITLERYVHSSLTLKRENMQKLTAVGL